MSPDIETAPELDTSLIGFIGLGIMGSFTIPHLLKLGHNLIVYDVDTERVKSMVELGCQGATSIADLAQKATCILSMVPGPQQAFDVYLGPNGVFENISNKNVYCMDCSTIGYHAAVDIRKAAKESGNIFLDTPMAGGAIGAKLGTLTFMIGSTEGEFNQIKEFFETFARVAEHCGPSGHGQLIKIVNNILVGIHLVAISEGYALASRLNGNLKKVTEAVQKSSGQAKVIDIYNPIPGLSDVSQSNNDYKPGFKVDLLLKDLNLAMSMAQKVNLELPCLQSVIARFELAKKKGFSDLDMSIVYKVYED